MIKEWLAGAGAVILALVAVFVIAFNKGKDNERTRQAADRIDALKNRREVDDEIANLGSNDIDERMARWLRDNPDR